MRAFLGKQFRALWEIALVVFGPAKNAPRVLSWWPIVVAVLGLALPVIGFGVPGDFAFDPVWWVVIALAVLLLLCFRALWILHAAVSRDFPRAEIDIKPSIAIHRDDPDVDLDYTLLFFNIRITNREVSHRLNLVFDMSLRWWMVDRTLQIARHDRKISRCETANPDNRARRVLCDAHHRDRRDRL